MDFTQFLHQMIDRLSQRDPDVGYAAIVLSAVVSSALAWAGWRGTCATCSCARSTFCSWRTRRAIKKRASLSPLARAILDTIDKYKDTAAWYGSDLIVYGDHLRISSPIGIHSRVYVYIDGKNPSDHYTFTWTERGMINRKIKEEFKRMKASNSYDKVEKYLTVLG